MRDTVGIQDKVSFSLSSKPPQPQPVKEQSNEEDQCCGKCSGAQSEYGECHRKSGTGAGK